MLGKVFIGVIVRILLVFFICLYFHCKDRVLVGKRNGGDVFRRVVSVKVNGNRVRRETIGAELPRNLPLVVMNQEGHEYLRKNGVGEENFFGTWSLFYDLYINHDIKDVLDVPIDDMIRHPAYFITGDEKFKVPSLMGFSDVDSFFAEAYNTENDGVMEYSKIKKGEIKESKTLFEFAKIVGDNTVFVELYEGLLNFIDENATNNEKQRRTRGGESASGLYKQKG